MSEAPYVLEKLFFTEEDFPAMGWHDNPIHAIAFASDSRELLLDIDYILKWEQPRAGKKHFRFWIGPATLVFENVAELSLSHEYYGGVTILSIEREEYQKEKWPASKRLWKWNFDCVEGSWMIAASGYRQFIRRQPVLLDTQVLKLADRGGYSFECPQRPNKAPEPTPTSVMPRANERDSK
jgi:hypothetical protein